VIREGTPAADGFAMPAEYQRHDGCYISWPCKELTWKGHFREATRSYVEVIRTIHRFEPVTVLATPQTFAEARRALGTDVEILELELDDSWIRDNGPIFVRREDGQVALVDFKFNGWGGKFLPCDKDDLAPVRIAGHLGMRCYEANLVLEGGAISVDGEGTLLTTEQCLLNPNRNPALSRSEIESALGEFLGIRKVIWLGRGLQGDVTDGHVDAVAGFVRPRTVLLTYPDDRDDPNRAALEENLNRLETATDAKGRSLEILKLVQPPPMVHEAIPLAPSYLNHYIANGGVVMPTYGIPEDRLALETLRTVYPDREVVGVYGAYLEIGGGVVHCITQQRPEGPPMPP